MEEYEQITYDVFDRFIRDNFPQAIAQYQNLEDVDERVADATEVELDALCNKLKSQDNQLQVIKKRRPSVYDEYRQNREKQIAEHLSDIE